MARIQLLLCFTILFATATLLDATAAEMKIKATMPQIEIPKKVKDVEPYTVNVVMVFVTNLEKECPKTSKFKAFFEKLRACAKFVCPLKRFTQKDDYDKDMKAKAGSLFQTISSFAIGKIREEIQEEKNEAIETFRKMKSLAGRIMGGRKKDEDEDSMELTPEQQKEIKEGILNWETVITKIANTMEQSTSSSTSVENTSTSDKGTSSGTNKNSGSESSFKDTTGSSSGLGSPSGSPSNSKSDSSSAVEGKSETSFKDTTGGSPISPSGSPKTSSSGESSISPSTSSTTSESATSAVGNSALTVTEVEAETSKEVMAFIMNLEKKCPPKEEYKSFFEKLKGTMTATVAAKSKVRKGLFAGIKSGAGRIVDAMAFLRSRIGSKSAEVKTSMENYQGEVMKAVQELDTIYSQIVSQNQGKKDGALTCTPEQQKQIKITITKWEQVTTQFVETAVQSESSSQSSSTTTSSSTKI